MEKIKVDAIFVLKPGDTPHRNVSPGEIPGPFEGTPESILAEAEIKEWSRYWIGKGCLWVVCKESEE